MPVAVQVSVLVLCLASLLFHPIKLLLTHGLLGLSSLPELFMEELDLILQVAWEILFLLQAFFQGGIYCPKRRHRIL